MFAYTITEANVVVIQLYDGLRFMRNCTFHVVSLICISVLTNSIAWANVVICHSTLCWPVKFMRNCTHFVSPRGEASNGESVFRDSFAKLGELKSIAKDGELNAYMLFTTLHVVNYLICMLLW